MFTMINELNDFTKSYTSFSGTDMVATCNILGETIVLGTLQTISYSLHMDRKPIRSIGNINAKDYTQGPRTIAGSLVFAVFDKHILYHMAEQFYQGNGSYKDNAYTALYDKYKSFTSNRHILSDELPPFDVTITLANEYGNKAKLAIYGIQLVNEGQVMSINDIYTENTYQFVAVDIDYLKADATSFAFKDEEPIEEIQAPQFNTNKDYNLLDLIMLEHINHDYTNSTSLLRITKTNISGTNYLHDGILYIKDLNSANNKYREYAIPDTTSNVYNKTLRLENGLYKAYFKETKSGLQTEEITIYIHDEDRSYNPIIDSIIAIPVEENSTIYKLHFRFICLSAIMHGHNKLRVLCDNDDVALTFNIDDYGMAIVPVDTFKANTDYTIYTARTDSSNTFEERMLSHLYHLAFTDYLKYDIVRYIDDNLEDKYRALYDKCKRYLITSNVSNKYSMSEALYLLYDFIIDQVKCNQFDLTALANRLYEIEYSLLQQINSVDSVVNETIVNAEYDYCTTMITKFIDDHPVIILVGDDIKTTVNAMDKYMASFIVKQYYRINKNKNAICSCRKNQLLDYRRNTGML